MAHLTDGQGVYIQAESPLSVDLTGAQQNVNVDLINETNVAVHISNVTAAITGIHRKMISGSGLYLWANGVAYPTTGGLECTPDDFTVTSPTPSSAQVVPGGGSLVWQGISVAFKNKASSDQDACLLATQLDLSFTMSQS